MASGRWIRTTVADMAAPCLLDHVHSVFRVPDLTKKAIAKLRISMRETVIAAHGGAWVYLGYNDLEKIVKALRGF